MRYWILVFLVFSQAAHATISKDQLHQVFKTFHDIYNPQLQENEQIIFNLPNGAIGFEWWDLDDFTAKYHSAYLEQDQTLYHYIFFFGGIARKPFMTMDGAAMILCHEMGHGFGGPPHKHSGATVEGEADYYSTRKCLKKYFSRHPRELEMQEITQKRLTLCQQQVAKFVDVKECLRGLSAIESRVISFDLIEKVPTSIFAKDDSVATEINLDDYYYPAQQCRVDTLIAGWFQRQRPACWMPSHE